MYIIAYFIRLFHFWVNPIRLIIIPNWSNNNIIIKAILVFILNGIVRSGFIEDFFSCNMKTLYASGLKKGYY
jgi:hypothetical protein